MVEKACSIRVLKHSTKSRVSPDTSFVLWPHPACLTTEQSTIKASLFFDYTRFDNCVNVLYEKVKLEPV